MPTSKVWASASPRGEEEEEDDKLVVVEERTPVLARPLPAAASEAGPALEGLRLGRGEGGKEGEV
jgi:hypothetical protein